MDGSLGLVEYRASYGANKKVKKNNIRDVGSTADLVLVLLVHLVHWYLVHLYPLLPDST